MSADPHNATFFDHLDDLRGVLLRAVLLFVLASIASFCVMPWIFDHIVMAPTQNDFITYRLFDIAARKLGESGLPPFSIDVVSLELTSQFFIHMSMSCWVALVVSFPFLIYIMWTFVSPALHKHERKGMRRAFLFGNVMFYLGVATSYFLVFPLSVRFLADYTLSDTIRPVVSLDSYIDNFFTLLVLMGAMFELPLLAWILGKMGLLTRSFFSHYRRHAIVVLLILAAVITPTGDPFTLFVAFIPIYALWELGARLVPKKNNQ